MRPTSPRLASLLAALLFLPAAARANGFALDIQGVRANATAGAAAGSGRDPAVQFVNPAALAALDGLRVTAGGMLVYPRAPYTDAGSTLAVGAPIPGQNGDGGQDGAAPWVFASARVSPSVVVGFQLTTPFGLATDYGQGSGFYGRYQGIESRIESLELGPSVGWNVGGRLAIGAAVSARRDRVVQSLSMDMGSSCVGARALVSDPDPVGTCVSTYGLVPGQTDAYGKFDGDGWSWTTTLGATLEPVPGTTIGLAWRHEIYDSVRGDETFGLPPGAAGFLAWVQGNLDPTQSSLTGSRASLKLRLPDFITLHGSHVLGPVKLLAALQWSRWIDFDTIDLIADSTATGQNVSSVQNYRNAFRFALGASWAVRPGLDLYGGAAFEQTPIQDVSRQPSLPETNNVILGLGGEVAVGAGLSLAAGWQHVEPTATGKIDVVDPATSYRLVGSAHARADLVLAEIAYRR